MVTRRAKLTHLSILLVPIIAACGVVNNNTIGDTDTQTSVETSVPASFEPKQVSPVTSQTPSKDITDPGINVQWRIRSVNTGSNGGAMIVLNLKNLNDVPLPPSALGTPTLNTAAAGSVELLNSTSTSDDATSINGLDLPLGAGATTTIRYVFNTTVSATSNAELQIANVIWKGNLSN